MLYADDSRRQELLRLPQLRNQQPDDETNLSLADFVAPAGSGIADYVGAFAATAGIGLNELAERFRRDVYKRQLRRIKQHFKNNKKTVNKQITITRLE